jgi:hypothetical protein
MQEAPFIVRGSHSAVTACLLPEWLPDRFVKYMNTVFGGQLRWELVEILSRPEVGRNHTQSTNSGRLSLDGLEQDSRTEVYENHSADYKCITCLK